jgi:hypothetical protein
MSLTTKLLKKVLKKIKLDNLVLFYNICVDYDPIYRQFVSFPPVLKDHVMEFS